MSLLFKNNSTPLFSEKITAAKTRHKKAKPYWIKPFLSKQAGQDYIRLLDVGLMIPRRIADYQPVRNLPNLDSLPPSCIVKPAVGNGNRGVFAIRNGYCHMSGEYVTRETILKTFADEKTISDQPVIVEEFITCAVRSEGLPRDYKFYNFGKDCAFLHIIERNSRKDQRKNRHFFLNEDLTPFLFQIQRTQKHSTDELVLPDYFPEMMVIAKRVSHSMWSFCRVDLYADLEGSVFGELAMYAHGGKGYLPDADKHLGSLWRGKDGVSRHDWIRYAPIVGNGIDTIIRRRLRDMRGGI